MFAELCATSRVHELARLHRSPTLGSRRVAAATSRRPRCPRRLRGARADHRRQLRRPPPPPRPGVARGDRAGQTIAITASTQRARRRAQPRYPAGSPRRRPPRPRPGGARSRRATACTSVTSIVTRRNDRRLLTTAGQPVRNRDRWTVTATLTDGALVVSHLGGHGTVTLPAEYAREHVRLGYAATEHGHQGDTVDIAYELVTRATTHRGLYVGATRGRAANQVLVVTDPATPPKPATSSSTSWPTTAPTSPPSPNAAISPPRSRPAGQPRAASPTGSTRSAADSSNDETTCTPGSTRPRRRAAKRRLDLAALQPELDAARAAWAPYAARIADLNEQLHERLKPARGTPRDARTPASAADGPPVTASPTARPRRRRRRSDRPSDRDQRRTVQAATSTSSPPEPARSATPPTPTGRAPTSTTSTASSSRRSNASSTPSTPGSMGRRTPPVTRRATAAVETITDASRALPAPGHRARRPDVRPGQELLPPMARRDQGIQLPRRVELGLEL